MTCYIIATLYVHKLLYKLPHNVSKSTNVFNKHYKEKKDFTLACAGQWVRALFLTRLVGRQRPKTENRQLLMPLTQKVNPLIWSI